MSGATVQGWISNHTLAENIITRHNTPNPTLDPQQFNLLAQFILDPSSKHLLETEAAPGTNDGNLATSIINRHSTSNPAFTDSELALLKKFFQSTDVDISSGAGPMVRSHTLAYNVILRPHEILDESELDVLRRFSGNPGERDAILKELGKGGEREKEGSLAVHCVETYGSENAALGEEEVRLLGLWFEKGGPVPVAVAI